MKRIALKIREHSLYTLLSALIPALIRFIPEMMFPYPIGFDTPLYLAMAKDFAAHPQPFRLFIVIIGLLHVLGVDLMVAMKFLPTLVYCLLGFSIFKFANRHLGWRDYHALLASINLTISVAMLRISWDMHKLALGVALLLLTLSMSKTLYVSEPTRLDAGRIAFFTLSMLTLITHELIAVLFMLTLIYYALRRRESRLFLITLLACCMSLFFGLWYWDRFSEVFGWIPAIFQSPPLSRFWPELQENGGLMVKLFPLYIPFIIIGFFRDGTLRVWTAFALFGSFSTLISPTFFLGGVLPWRYILLLAVPFSLYSIKGLMVLAKNVKPIAFLALILLMNLPSLSFVGLTDAFAIYTSEGTIPKNMVQTCIPLHDIGPTIRLLKNVTDGVLIVYGDFVGWASYFSNAKVVTFGGTYPHTQTLEDALRISEGENNIYLLYWDDNVAANLGFKIIATDGHLKLYKYAEGVT